MTEHHSISQQSFEEKYRTIAAKFSLDHHPCSIISCTCVSTIPRINHLQDEVVHFVEQVCCTSDGGCFSDRRGFWGGGVTDNCDLDSSSQQRRPGRHHGLLGEDNWLNCRANALAPDKSSSWLFGAGKGWEAVWGHAGGAHKVWGGRRPARWSLGGGAGVLRRRVGGWEAGGCRRTLTLTCCCACERLRERGERKISERLREQLARSAGSAVF